MVWSFYGVVDGYLDGVIDLEVVWSFYGVVDGYLDGVFDGVIDGLVDGVVDWIMGCERGIVEQIDDCFV